MTELETQLLNALEQLQQDYGQRLSEWDGAFGELQAMFGVTRQDCARLSQQVEGLNSEVERLSKQVTSLNGQLRRLLSM